MDLDLDRELLNSFVEGDPAAVTMFIEKYGPVIMNVAKKYVYKKYAQVFSVNDLFQDIMFHIYNKRNTIVNEYKARSSFRVYLYAVCRYRAMATIKKEYVSQRMCKRSAEMENVPSSLLEDIQIYDDEMKRNLRKVINQLEDDDRLFIKMCYYDDKTTEELGKMFEISNQNSVYTRKHRILKKIKQKMEKYL